MLENEIQGNRICILGFGREGQSTYHFIRKHFPGSNLIIADQCTISSKSFSFLEDDNKVKFATGPDYLDKLPEFDLCFKTPGISLQTIQNKIPKRKITSQADLFLKYYGRQTIGITGTKGKSTTSSLLKHLFNLAKIPNVLVGNIGIPPFDFADEISNDTVIINELSSHQLETVNHSPFISVLLNIFEEHLDHYVSFLDYALAKFNIFRFQEKGDYAILNADDKILMELLSKMQIPSELIFFGQQKEIITGCFVRKSFVECKLKKNHASFNVVDKLKIKGRHNLYNVMAAVLAAKLAGLDDSNIHHGLLTFKGLSHRMESLGIIDGVHFYNDSISTVPQATIEAIKTLGDVSYLIIGGYDRGIDYEYLVSYLASLNIKSIMLMGPAGKRMWSLFSALDHKPAILKVKNLKEAVNYVKQHAKNGEKCLLSPAAASYDAFRNFEERGKMFEKYVRQG